MSLAAVPFLSGARLVASSLRGSSPMLGSARLYTSSPFLCAALPRCSMLFLCGSLSGSASRLRSGASPLTSIAACCNVARSISGAGYAFPERYGVSLCFSVAERCLRHGAVRCPRLPCHAMPRNAFAGPILAAHSKAFALPSLPSTPRLRSAVKCHSAA